MGEDWARGKDWLRARGHHLCLTDNFLVVLVVPCTVAGHSLIHNFSDVEKPFFIF